MKRRCFIGLGLLAPWALSLSRQAYAHAARVAEPVPNGAARRFTLSAHGFSIDARPFQIRSGEMHPARIPREHWRHRIRMARAMGLNTIALYVMWNYLELEPGKFDLHSENRDFPAFIRLCQEEGMWVYLRPGPYVCAEWDLGGLPGYLLRDPSIRFRTRRDARYMAAVERYIATIAPHIVPLLAAAGGPILMVQIENEYGFFGDDLGYLQALRALWQAHGVHGPFSMAEGLDAVKRRHIHLQGTALGLDGDGHYHFDQAQAIADDAPVWVSEGYPGWLTHWGESAFASKDYTASLRMLMRERRSFNLYVVHGGSNFGLTAGANADDDYSHFQPVITSYDYAAPISEHGAATPAYHAFRNIITAADGLHAPPVPRAPPMQGFAAVTPVACASLWDNLPSPLSTPHPVANEILLGQNQGLVLYRRRIAAGGRLQLDGVRDYATVHLGGRYLDYVSRVRDARLRSDRRIPLPTLSSPAWLEILVDSFGHVNFGHAMHDYKGLLGKVRVDGRALAHWDVHGFALDPAMLAALRPLTEAGRRPGLFYRAEVTLSARGGTYIDMSRWNKGYVWVNGHLLGRYWHIGPQQHLYCPAGWLREGRNSVLILDLHQMQAAPIQGSASQGPG